MLKMIASRTLLALASSIIFFTLVRTTQAREVRPPGTPNWTHPYAPAERIKAAERVWEVYAAIDEATNNPEWRAELRRVCRRESKCNWMKIVGLHRGETNAMGRKRWKRAVDRGLLHPETCEHHQLGDTPSRWTVNGAFGAATAYVLRHTGECTPPESILDPRVGAVAAVGHMEVLCRRHKACTCEGRTRWWVGPGVWAGRPALRNLKSLKSQCGERPWWEYVAAAWEDYAQPMVSSIVEVSLSGLVAVI